MLTKYSHSFNSRRRTGFRPFCSKCGLSIKKAATVARKAMVTITHPCLDATQLLSGNIGVLHGKVLIEYMTESSEGK